MNPRAGKASLATASVLTSLLSFGCLSDQRRGLPHAIGQQLAANAVNYNLAIEKSQNEVLLLNVIRAMQHRPLYLTDASKVTGTINGSFTLGLSIPWGKGSDDGPEPEKPSVAPSVTYSTSPAMDVNLLDSQDFVAGFLKPIPPKLFTYYWDQNWPAEFLLHMLVLKVDRYDEQADGQVRLTATYQNHPIGGATGKIEAFSSWVRWLVSEGRPWTKSPANPYQKTLDVVSQDVAEKNSILANLDLIAKDQGLTFSPFDDYVDANPLGEEPEPPKTPKDEKKDEKKDEEKNKKRTWKWTLATADEIRTLVYRPPALPPPATGKDSAPLGDTKPGKRSDIGAGAAFGSRILVIPRPPDKDPKTGLPIPPIPPKPPIFVMTLRSPEGVLFYLGELAGMANPWEKVTAPKVPPGLLLIHAFDKDGSTAPLVPLFSLKSSGAPAVCRSLISVRGAQDAEFFIPTRGPSEGPIPSERTEPIVVDPAGICQPGESMHALSLLSQLIGLQKSAKDFPTTSTVKVVGQ